MEVKNTKILENISKQKIEDILRNKRFVKTYRHGKYIFIKTNKTNWLILHFGMTGYVKYFKNLDQEPSHTRLLITFENGYHFAFSNQRLLGKVGLTDNEERYIEEKNLGIDAQNLDLNTFKDILKSRKGMIKSALMNQHIISGIGNIFADEILFQSGIHPKMKIKDLSNNKLNDMYNNLDEILNVAINVKSDVDELPNNYIIPNREKNGICPKGGEKLRTIKVNGRTTYFCPIHQKKK
jgi:formamidopyrimidine-DNA glycosylase